MDLINETSRLQNMANRMRKTALELAKQSGNNAAHLGPGLSIIDVLAVLYGHSMTFNKENIENVCRDRFILSKEHGVLAYYAALYEAGILTEADLAVFMKTASAFLGHPVMNRPKGIEFTSGSLGMGLSLGVGVAIAMKRKNLQNKVYVLVGDGECNEGSIWEAVMSASQFQLDNLVLIVDRNGLQLGAKTSETLDLNDMASKFREFGWHAEEVNGHSISDLINVFDKPSIEGKPHAIIANTIKGYGVSFMEHNVDWHHAVLTEKLYNQAMEEQVK